MSQKLQPVRGTHDILPDYFEKFHAVVTLARELATLYGFREMATPIFEQTDVFSRSMGETSDVVSKEMFTFQTKGEESVTLRPEFTAGIVRAFLSNGMQQHLPLKLFSTGPLFRYERPQKGRQRQFHQVNFEWLGDGSWQADVEIICLAGHLLFSLDAPQNYTLLINTLGDKESRAKYREALVSYLTPFARELSEDSQRRLISNPLRILDSKGEQDKKIIQEAPQITDYLNDNAKRRFDSICGALSSKDIPFYQKIRIEPATTLVRGLDYYTDTVFEFVSNTGELGAQNTVLAGGRYDGLIEQMGGKSTPAVGFAAGVERLLMLSTRLAEKPRTVVLLPLDGVSSESVLHISAVLRNGFYWLQQEQQTVYQHTIEILWQGNLGKRLGKAAERGATHAIIMGLDEIKRDVCKIKNMEKGTELEISIDDFADKNKLIKLFNLDSRLRGNDEL